MRQVLHIYRKEENETNKICRAANSCFRMVFWYNGTKANVV